MIVRRTSKRRHLGMLKRDILASRAGVAILLALAAFVFASPLVAQSALAVTFAPGGRELVLLDFSTLPLGPISSADLTRTGMYDLRGQLEVVMKDGVHMLRAAEPSTFLLRIPEVLPTDFTLEFDLVPKNCCNSPQDLAFEGTSEIRQDAVSAHVLWRPSAVQVIGGLVNASYDKPMPAALSAVLPGSLANIAVSLQGRTMRMFTNGQELYSLDRAFARGRVLRVFLGGQLRDRGEPVYLARLRIAASVHVTAAVTQPPTAPPNVTRQAPHGTGSSASTGNTPTAPTSLKGTDLDLHLLLQWAPVPGAVAYRIHRKEAGSPAAGALLPHRVDYPTGVPGAITGMPTVIDPYLVPNVDMVYVVEAVFADGTTSPPSSPLTLRTPSSLGGALASSQPAKDQVGPSQGTAGSMVTWTWQAVNRHFGYGIAIDIVPNAGLGATQRVRDFLFTPPTSHQTVSVSQSATTWSWAVPANSTVYFCYSRWRLDHPATAVPDLAQFFPSRSPADFANSTIACRRTVVP